MLARRLTKCSLSALRSSSVRSITTQRSFNRGSSLYFTSTKRFATEPEVENPTPFADPISDLADSTPTVDPTSNLADSTHDSADPTSDLSDPASDLSDSLSDYDLSDNNYSPQVEAGDHSPEYLEEEEDQPSITDYSRILHYLPEILSVEEKEIVQEEAKKVPETTSNIRSFTREDKFIFDIIRKYREEPEKIWGVLEDEGLLTLLSNRHTYPFMRAFINHPEELQWKTKLLETLKVLKVVPTPNCYHEVIVAHANSGNLEKATQLYKELKKTGKEPHIDTVLFLTSEYTKSIPELCAKGEIDQVRLALRATHEQGFIPTPRMYTTIVETYIKHSKFEQASDVLRKAAERGHNLSRDLYKKLILAHISNGNPDRAKWVIDDMSADNIYVPRELSNLVTQALIASDQTKLASDLKADTEFRTSAKILHNKILKEYSIN